MPGPSEHLLEQGSSVSGWRVLQRLGAGGMAEVYLAEHPRLRREDVIKVMRPFLAQDVGFTRKFRDEADRLTALSGHDHIVTIFDQVEDDGMLCLVLQYAKGGDLRKLLQREGRLPLEAVLDIGRQVASALDAGHALGIIHRDVKPENVLLKGSSVSESVLLSDFGISFLAEGTAQQSTVTQSLLTPAYAAPEQFEAHLIDGRTDQYSLACMLYELGTGRPPFPAANAAALMKSHLFDPPPPLPPQLGLPQALNGVFARALAKNPRERFPSCAAFVEGLRQAAMIPPRPQPAPAQRPGWPPQPAWNRGGPGQGGPQQSPGRPTPPVDPRPQPPYPQSYGPPPLRASATGPHGGGGGGGVGRVLLQVLYFAIPVVTLGLASWGPALWAAIATRSRRALVTSIGLFLLFILFIVAVSVAGDVDSENRNETADALAAVLLLSQFALGETAAVLFRRQTFARRGASLDSDPAVAAAMAGRQRRSELRSLAANDPALARNLRIGRPDLPREINDAGLVDVNAVGPEVLMRGLGVSAVSAHSIIGARERIGAFSSVDEVIYYGELPPDAAERVRDLVLLGR